MGFFKIVTGVMGSGKSTRYISDYNSLIYRKCNVVTMKSTLDTRDSGEISSRNMEVKIGVDFLLAPDSKIPVADIVLSKSNYIMVDEAQFLTTSQILGLYRLTTFNNINVILYGLRMCWKGIPFTSMQVALGLADETDVIRVYNDRGEELTHQIITVDGVPLEITKEAPEVYVGDIVGKDTPDSKLEYHTVTKAEFYSIYKNIAL